MKIQLSVTLSLLITVQYVAAEEWLTLECKLQGLDAHVLYMDFSPDDKTLVVGSRDGTLQLFDVASHELLTTQKLKEDWIQQVSFSPDGELIAVATLKGKLIFWERDLSKERFSQRQPRIACFSFHPDSKSVLIGRWNAALDIFDIKRKAKVRTLQDEVATRSVAWSPDGRFIACGIWGDVGEVFECKRNTMVLHLARHRKIFPPVAFSPDSNILAIGGTGVEAFNGRDNEVLLWNLKEGKEHKRLRAQSWELIDESASQVTKIAYCPNGKLLAASDFERTRVWDVQCETVIFAYPEHGDSEGPLEQSMAFSHDGRYFALSTDKEVGLWRLP